MITFTFDTNVIELPNPQLGDTLTKVNPIIPHRSMNGTLWTTVTLAPETLRWNFSAVKRVKIKELEAFLKTYRGETIEVIDHHGIEFNAKIIGLFNSTDDSRHNCLSTPAEPDPIITPNIYGGSFSLVLEKVA